MTSPTSTHLSVAPPATVRPATLTRERYARLAQRAKLLSWLSLAWMTVEGVVAVVAGVIASSIALIGFGLDSVIEVASAAAVAWQFAGPDHERREKVTLRVIAGSFFALAAYVTVDSVRALTGTGEAQHSTPGIVLAALSLAVMPFLSAAQRRAGRELGSASAVADSKQTLLCTYLSAVLLVGLILNATLGWSWADPLAGLVIAAIAAKEGLQAWRGEGCCPVGGGHGDQHDNAQTCRPTDPGNVDVCCDGTADALSATSTSSAR